VPEEQNEAIREIVLRPSRIVYQILAGKQTVAVARIWHGARGEPEIPTHLEF